MGNVLLIRKRLSLLEEYLSHLRDLQPLSVDEFTTTYQHYGLAERYLQLAIEVTIDLGNHIIAEQNLGYVEVSRDIPDIFEKKGYITAAFCETWKRMIGFRNLLVHDYADIDRAIVYAVLQQRLSDLERLRAVFAQFI